MSDIPAFPYELLWGERVIRSVANLTRADGEEFLATRSERPGASGRRDVPARGGERGARPSATRRAAGLRGSPSTVGAMASNAPSAASGPLVLADISGYTAFLQSVASAHAADAFADGNVPEAYAILTRLLDGIVERLVPPFTLSKLEGDAVFAFATERDAVPTGSDVLMCFARLLHGLSSAGRVRAGDLAVLVRGLREHRRAGSQVRPPRRTVRDAGDRRAARARRAGGRDRAPPPQVERARSSPDAAGSLS